MLSLTLDINGFTTVDDGQLIPDDLLKLVEAARRGEADIAMLASSAFQHQPGGGHFDRFVDFQARMLAIGLGDITLLRPMARHGLSFRGFGILSDEAAVVRERLIFKTLFPSTPLRWTDYAIINDLDIKDLRSTGAWKWLNCLGAAQAFWAHEKAERDVFVTRNEVYSRLKANAAFSDAVVLTPNEAAQILAERRHGSPYGSKLALVTRNEI